MRRWIVAVIVGLTFVCSGTAYAWNGAGHRTIAYIAYSRLDPETRAKVAAILRRHPAMTNGDWPSRKAVSSGNEELDMFMNASVFPDDARDTRGSYADEHRPTWHYINFPIVSEEAKGDPSITIVDPRAGETAFFAHDRSAREAADRGANDVRRAIALSWIFHLDGDIHMPLHAVARYSKAFPEGDRGGNSVRIERPGKRPTNLHAYWDGLILQAEDFATVRRTADDLLLEFPADSLPELKSPGGFEAWAEESVDVARKLVYRDLDPMQTTYRDALPVAYAADAQRAARRRAILAGYRLAEDLKSIVAAPGK